MLTGRCLCGSLTFEIQGPIHNMGHCHCSKCRKAYGGAFGTFAQVASADLKILTGREGLRAWRSSATVERTFCGTCGSPFTYHWDGMPSVVWVVAGLLDEDPQVRPDHHIFVGSKAPWHEITDELDQFEQYPPAK